MLGVMSLLYTFKPPELYFPMANLIKFQSKTNKQNKNQKLHQFTVTIKKFKYIIMI